MLIDQKNFNGTNYGHGFDRTYESDIFSLHLEHSPLPQRDDNKDDAIGGSKPD